jgi:hypothetical protein
MDCQTVRDDIHVEPTSEPIRAHLAGCPRCAAYAERFARLDQLLCTELVRTAPVALSAQLETLPSAAVLSFGPLETMVRDELVKEAPAALSARLLALVPTQAMVEAKTTSPVEATLRNELVLQAPIDLTARLQALVPQMAASLANPEAAPVPVVVQPVPTRPRRWVVATVYFVTAALLLVSLFYAGQLYSAVAVQLGIQEWLAEVAKLPGTLLTQLYNYVPQARTVVGILVQLQQPLQWLLVALVLWAVIDMTQRQGPRQTENGRQYA